MTTPLSIPQMIALAGLASATIATALFVAFRLRDHLAERRVRNEAARNPVLYDILARLESAPSLPVRRVLGRRPFLEDVAQLNRWVERHGPDAVSDAYPEPFPDDGLLDRHLVQIRKGSDEIARAAAAGLLGWTARTEIVAPLLAAAEIANRRSPLLRKMALNALARVQHPDAIQEILAALGRAEDDLIDLLISLCTDMGAPIVDAVAESLSDSANPASVRINSCRILGGIDHHSAMPPLLVALSDRDAEIRAAAAAGLHWAKDTQVAERLYELLLADPVPLVRSEAARSMATLSAEQTIRTLASTLCDPSPTTRVRVVEALQQFGPSAREILVVALSDPDQGVAIAAARALQGNGAIDEAICSLATDGYEATSTEFLIAVGRSGHLEPLLEALEVGAERLKREIVRILGRIGDPKAGEALARVLDDESMAPIRSRTVEALRRTGDASQVQRVLPLLLARDEWVRKTAMDYLAEHGGTEITDQVVPLLDDPNPWTRASALRLLEVLARPGFDPAPVQQRLADSYDSVRAQAIRTLCASHEFEILLNDDVMDQLAEDRLRNALLRALGDHATVVAMPLITRLAAFCSDRNLDLLRYAARRAVGGLESEDIDLLMLGYADPAEETSARWFASIAWPRASQNAAAVWRDELLTDPDPRVRAGTIAALAERDESRADLIVAVHRALDDSAPIVVRAALATAGRRILHELDAAISDTLRHPDEDVRVDAIFVQGLLGGGTARADSLALADGSAAERVAAAAARLLLDDPKAVIDWIDHLRMGSERRIAENWILGENPLFRSMRGVAAERTDSLPSRVLLCRSGFEIEELLAGVLNSSLRESDRLLALRTMIAAGTDRCLSYIRGAFFRDISPGVRAEALAYLAERNAFHCTREYIEIALEDSSEMVRVRATRLIGLLSTPVATRLLADRLGTGTRVERAAIIERLAVLLQECGEDLLEHILHPELPVQAIADLARVLDHCTLPFCVEVLETLFEHPAPLVRNASLRPLLRRLGEEGWPIVERGLRDSESKVRAHAVQSLGSPAAEALHADLDRMRRALREAHADSDPEVRSRTAAAVAKLGFEGATGILGTLERDDDPRVERIARQARAELERRRQPTGI